MGLIGIAVKGLHAAAGALERAERPHGPWCDRSKGWTAPVDEFIVPIRISEEYLDKMLSPEGWEAQIGGVFVRHAGDRTYNMIFKEADVVDHVANRAVQRMVMAALDLGEALDMGNDDLSEDVIEALAEFKKAARARLGGRVQ